jgi:prevent-host-death family protein
MLKTVSAYEARTNLGELLNLVYYKGIEVVVEKMGKPVVKITRIKKEKDKIPKEELIKRYAGILTDKEAKEIRKNIKKFRKNFQLIRKVSL